MTGNINDHSNYRIVCISQDGEYVEDGPQDEGHDAVDEGFGEAEEYIEGEGEFVEDAANAEEVAEEAADL